LWCKKKRLVSKSELKRGNGQKKEKEMKMARGEENVLIRVKEDERKASGISSYSERILFLVGFRYCTRA
jgi:hypothetical protein